MVNPAHPGGGKPRPASAITEPQVGLTGQESSNRQLWELIQVDDGAAPCATGSAVCWSSSWPQSVSHPPAAAVLAVSVTAGSDQELITELRRLAAKACGVYLAHTDAPAVGTHRLAGTPSVITPSRPPRQLYPAWIEVPRDRGASFDPVIVRKRLTTASLSGCRRRQVDPRRHCRRAHPARASLRDPPPTVLGSAHSMTRRPWCSATSVPSSAQRDRNL
jgi:hypothetical protein